MLTEAQRSRLLQIARKSIDRVLHGQRPPLDSLADTEEEALSRPSGVFVTLRTGELELRGCIGSILPVSPLWKAVAENAVNAAFRDPRFPPLEAGEWPEVTIEISVMSPIEPVESVDEIVPGRDGLIVRSGRHAGLLLPQVATEYAWDRDTFLAHTCMKAGLPPDAWRSPSTRIERFSAEVFAEPTH